MPKSQTSKSQSRKSKPRKLQTPGSRRASGTASQPETLPYSSREFGATWFSFFKVCKNRACARAARCSGGEVPPCFAMLWPLIDEREKVKFRTALKALADGANLREALAAGEADAVGFEALDAALDAAALARNEAAGTVKVPASVPASAPARPFARVRSL